MCCSIRCRFMACSSPVLLWVAQQEEQVGVDHAQHEPRHPHIRNHRISWARHTTKHRAPEVSIYLQTYYTVTLSIPV